MSINEKILKYTHSTHDIKTQLTTDSTFNYYQPFKAGNNCKD